MRGFREIAPLLALGAGMALAAGGCIPFEPREDSASRKAWEGYAAAVKASVDAGREALPEGSPVTPWLAAGSGVLSLLGFGVAAAKSTEAKRLQKRLDISREAETKASDNAWNDREALGITMAALEHAAPEVRKLARNAARKAHLSTRLERMISEGWIPDIDGAEKGEAPSPKSRREGAS